MAVPTDDPPIGEGAVLFGRFGDFVVLSKKENCLDEVLRSVLQIEQMHGFDMMSVN